MYLRKLNDKFDIEELLPLLDHVTWDKEGRCSLNKTDGNFLYDSYEVLPQWRGTAFQTLLDDIPYPIGEARLIKLEPGECYRSHSDIDDRYHINLVASDQCFLVDLDNQELHKIETDGYLYKMDGSYLHSAINLGGVTRIQLVIRIPLQRYDIEDGITVTLKFVKPPYNLRYIVDQHISPLLNNYSKQGLLGYFNLKSPTEYDLHISPKALNTIKIRLNNLNIEYEIL